MPKDLAIVLNNGSINSAVATALAAQRHRVVMLYAHTAASDGVDDPAAPDGPRAAFDRQVAHFKPHRDHVLDLSFLADAREGVRATPPPADPRQVPPIGPKLMDLIPLVGIALRFAAHHQAAAVHLGLRVGPSGDPLVAGTEFGQVFTELVQLPCGQPDLSVELPLLELEAWQVIDLGTQAGVPFDRTWSCERPGPEACWACPGCRAREAAFQRAAKPDPLRVLRKVG